MDVWQCALEDVGPAGLDKGKGGKYLILPPGYKNKAPTGYRINLFLGKNRSANAEVPEEHVVLVGR